MILGSAAVASENSLHYRIIHLLCLWYSPAIKIVIDANPNCEYWNGFIAFCYSQKKNVKITKKRKTWKNAIEKWMQKTCSLPLLGH